ncbi:MAG: EAL domain-containing protein [Burkholderiales bacterium]
MRLFFQRITPSSLKARLLLLVMLAALPAMASVIASALNERALAVDMMRSQASAQTRHILARHDEVESAARQLLDSIASLPAIRSGNAKACSERLAMLLQSGGPFANLGMLDAQGALFCSGIAPSAQDDIDFSDRVYFQRALSTQGFATGDYRFEHTTATAFIDYALPLHDGGKLRGVLFASFPLATLLRSAHATHLPPQGSVVTLLDPGFTVVTRFPPDEHVGTNIVGTAMHRLLATAATEDVGATEGLSPGQRIAAFTTIRLPSGEMQGHLAIGMPEELVLASTNRALVRNLAYIMLIFIAIGVLAATGSEVLVLRQIRGLLAATRKIAAGDLGARAPVAGNTGELAVLGTAFNDMANRIEAQVRSIESLNRIHAMLSAINAAVLCIRDRDELLNETCRIAVEVGGYCAACIYLAGTNPGLARLAAHAGACGAVFQDSGIEVDGSSPQHDGPIPKRLADIVEATSAAPCGGCSAAQDFPLAVAGKVLGTLALFSPRPGAFDSEQEIRLLRELAADTALGLEHIEKEAQIARLTRVRKVLTEINGALLRMQKSEEMAQEACRIAVKSGSYLAACIIIVDQDITRCRIAGHAGAGRDYFDSLVPDIASTLRHADTPLAKALRSGDHAIAQNFALEENHPFEPRLSGLGVRAVAAFPLRMEGRISGALVLWSSNPQAFDGEETLLLQQLAADTGLGLEHIEQQTRVYRLSNFDQLTGLPNRDLFKDRAAQILARMPRLQRVAAVLALRIGRFRQINDQHGWAAGDRIITHVARYLNEVSRPGDTVARWGDNEFMVLLADMHDIEDAVTTVDRIITDFPATVPWEDGAIVVESNTGIAIFPDDGADIQALIHNAELALNNIPVSSRHNAFTFYSAELDQQARQRHRMEIELAGAVKRNELSLAYQPVIHIADRTLIGAEALLRWHNRKLGQVSPAAFVPLAEKTGLIEPIGDWVFETVCAQRAAWQRGRENFSLAVNVSVRQLRSPGFLQRVSRHLEKNGLAPARHPLCVEITESELMEDVKHAALTLKQLKAMGIGVAVDDFGTGYSSLSYIRYLPLDRLKIDISFVREIAVDANAKAVAASIVALGHSLNLMVVAEGVETEAQLRVLAEMDCDAAQGYLFSAPLPAAAFEAMLK